jgi:hypothetical protein
MTIIEAKAAAYKAAKAAGGNLSVTEGVEAGLKAARAVYGGRLPSGTAEQVTAAARKGHARGVTDAGKAKAAKIASAARSPEGRTKAAVASAYESCGYRVAHGSWAGGSHTTSINVGHAPGVSCETEKAWSENRKWSGLDSHHSIAVAADWRNTVPAPTGPGAVVDAMLTLSAKRLPARALPAGVVAWAAAWVVQSRGTAIRVDYGVIVRSGAHTVHATNVAGGVTIIARRVEADAARAAQATMRAAQAAITVTTADAAQAGLCPTGTADWIARWMPGRTEATAGELRALVSRHGDRGALVERAITSAAARIAMEAA